MASSLPSSPEGIVINRHWRIGKRIGDGACGSVHELVQEKNKGLNEGKGPGKTFGVPPVIHAIKLAPLPDLNSKPKSKENVRRKTHADILHYEGLVYQNHLVDLRGTLIPELPLRPVTGDAEGYRFLIMEKMAASFDQVVSDIASGKRSFSTVASHLISLVEAVHSRKLLVIDIKPDNFMVSSAGQIVMIDLGLVQSYASLGGHRANDAGGGVVGTPLYASLHLFQGETPSRRDDLEALLYMLMEVILTITAGKELPWSHGRSEEEIGTLKQHYMLQSKSSIWKTLGSAAAPALRSFFEQVHSFGYNKKPDYDALRKLFQNIEIGESCQKKKARPAKASTRTPKKPSADKATQAGIPSITNSPCRTTATSRRAAAGIEAPQIVTKKRASPVNLAGRPTKKHGVAHTDDVYRLQDSDVDDDYQTWEMLNLIHGEQEKVVFGRCPEDPYEFLLSGDPSVDLVHAQVTLQVNKRLVTVLVKDLKSSAGTVVEKVRLGAGKSQKAFINDTIVLGKTIIKVLPLKPGVSHPGFTSTLRTKDIQDFRVQESTEKENATPIPISSKAHSRDGPAAKPRGFRLEFTAGPYQGASIVLQDGAVDTIVLGANPHPKSGNIFRLNKDASITDSSHVRLELDASRKAFCSLRAIDLKSTLGFRLNGIQVGKGKKEMAFANDSLHIGSSVVQIKPL
ncbi:hypothetical protein MHU86_5858 [Fragilaria crotonensis]|nr:hypothetical protein MHU86_5858 [Fragilaria crotonensis]